MPKDKDIDEESKIRFKVQIKPEFETAQKLLLNFPYLAGYVDLRRKNELDNFLIIQKIAVQNQN